MPAIGARVARGRAVPTLDHEALVELFRARPALAVELLRVVDELELEHVTARIGSIDLSQATPPEFRCDALVELFDPARPDAPVTAIVVEIQRTPDPDKRRSWPVYVTVAAARLGCPVKLLVVTSDAAVGRWAAQPIELGHPGFVLRPIVLGFDRVPRIVDLGAARVLPELAVLSALAHRDAETAEVAWLAISDMPDDQQRLYWDLILTALPDAARTVLESTMLKHYEYQSDFARKYHGEGLQEGRQEGSIKMVRKFLVEKFGPLEPDIEARLASANDEELDELPKRILHAISLDDVFRRS
jgi:hypothetical protein